MRPPVSHDDRRRLRGQRRAVEDARSGRLLHHPSVRGGRQHVARERRRPHHVVGDRESDKGGGDAPGCACRARQGGRRRCRRAAPPSAARRRRTARTTETSGRRDRAAPRGERSSRRRSSARATSEQNSAATATATRIGTPSRWRATGRADLRGRPASRPTDPTAIAIRPSAMTPQPRLTCCSSSPSPTCAAVQIRRAAAAEEWVRDGRHEVAPPFRAIRKRSSRGNARRAIADDARSLPPDEHEAGDGEAGERADGDARAGVRHAARIARAKSQ